MTSLPRWYVVHTQPNAEARAKVNLENQDFETFLPKRVKTVTHARRRRTIAVSFFPRYLFVRLDVDHQRWRSVNGTIGVARLLTHNDRPQPVQAGIVEALIAATDENGIVKLSEKMVLGGAVRILAGPFADQLATLENLRDGERVSVLFNFLGREIIATTRRSDVLPLPGGSSRR